MSSGTRHGQPPDTATSAASVHYQDYSTPRDIFTVRLYVSRNLQEIQPFVFLCYLFFLYWFILKESNEGFQPVKNNYVVWQVLQGSGLCPNTHTCDLNSRLFQYAKKICFNSMQHLENQVYFKFPDVILTSAWTTVLDFCSHWKVFLVLLAFVRGFKPNTKASFDFWMCPSRELKTWMCYWCNDNQAFWVEHLEFFVLYSRLPISWFNLWIKT